MTSTTSTSDRKTDRDADLTLTVTVAAPPERAWAAINDPRGWWNESITGESGTVGDAYDYAVPGVHRCRMTTTVAEPERRLVWAVSRSHLGFTDDPDEWEGTRVEFDLRPAAGGGTEITFTHVGLAPRGQCFGVCADAWGGYITRSLPAFIDDGAGAPMRRTDTVDLEEVRRLVRRG